MFAWAVTMGAGATMGSCIRRLPFHPKEGVGPKSITLTSEMAKYNYRVCLLMFGKKPQSLRLAVGMRLSQPKREEQMPAQRIAMRHVYLVGLGLATTSALAPAPLCA